ncbi:hypothetical protein VNI00_010482 [Paramarasmius palmivorus]|uniref:Uncharacterized protein n=1 Tax=Paramarasmius palmivorus TaxID=297713 RepID=A0AAW0CJA2_9AGAR
MPISNESQSIHTLFKDSPMSGVSRISQSKTKDEDKKGGRFWRWDALKGVMVLDSECEHNANMTLKTSAEPQITLDSSSVAVTDYSESTPSFIRDESSLLVIPPTPMLPSTPTFKPSYSSSFSLALTTPGDGDALFPIGSYFPYESESSASIYHSTQSSFSQPPLTPCGIGLGFSGLTKPDGQTPFDGLGIVSIHSTSPWRTSSPRPARHPNPPSQMFLDEIYRTFQAPAQDDIDWMMEMKEEREQGERQNQKARVMLTRNLSAPTTSSALKRTTRMQRSNTVPVWR